MKPRPNDGLYNPEGYRDPTAYDAIRNITEEEEKVTVLINIIKSLLRITGFELIRRIEIRSLRSGREYR